MALTARVKDELARVVVSRQSARAAETAALLRFSGQLQMVAGRLVLEAELDSAAVARRLAASLREMYGVEVHEHTISPGGVSKSSGTSSVSRRARRTSPAGWAW